MIERTDHIGNLMMEALRLQHDRGPLRQEVTDAQWADYGRMVAARLGATDDLIATFNRASMRSTTVIEIVGYIRAFILTGTKP